MAGGYDGSIRIDTLINDSPIDNGIGKIEDKIKGLGAAIGIAFGAKELISFGQSAVNAASDLSEAQNVVDTAFGEMSYKMEQFASTALETYGISELTAKTMGSTYMAMAKGMGVATDAASDMAVTLTGRLSDIMSFYNKTQSEVDTIGRAVITGETEPLKAIGVVMTQTNLEAYAMAQGLSKTYSEMSANEQLLVRYKYFLEQTSLAQGDFAKTSDSWANQTRLLSERLNQFMTNLGNVLINTFTPALQFVNEAVSFFNDLFFGGNEEDTTAAKNAEVISDEVAAVGTAAEKSQKKLNGLISGFEELHVISGADNDDDNTSSVGIDTSDLLGVSLDADTSTAKNSAKKYRDILNEIYLAFRRHPLTKLIETIINDIGDFFGFVKDNGDIDYGGIITVLEDLLAAFLAYKAVSGVVSGVSTFSGAFGKLIGIITAHPVAAAIVGLIALGAAIYDLTIELKRQEIASKFGEISISFEEINELVDPITKNIDKVSDAFDDNKSKLETAQENFSDIAEAVRDTMDAFKNGNSEKSVESFAEQLDEFIDSALGVNSAVSDTSALESLFLSDGVIDDEERNILNKISGMETSIAGKIETIRAQIHEITQVAVDENRELLESELENIQRLYDEIAQMTAQQENIKTSATWERLKNGAYTYNSYAELADEIQKAQEQADESAKKIEQSAYEDIMNKVNYAKANGATDAEIDALKESGFEAINKSIRDMEVESKKYQRDVILAWTEGAFVNISKYIDNTAEGQKKMKQYFDLLVSSGGSNADIQKLAEELGDTTYYKGVMDALDEINNQFGLRLTRGMMKRAIFPRLLRATLRAYRCSIWRDYSRRN